MEINKVKGLIERHPLVAYPLLGVLGLALISLMLNASGSKINTEPSSMGSIKHTTGNIGISVGGANKDAYLARLEKNYYDFEDRVKGVESQVKQMTQLAGQLKDNQKEINKTIRHIDNELEAKVKEELEQFKQEELMGNSLQTESKMRPVELVIADISPIIVKENMDDVYLPMGSFCKGTLLTGVYAAADQNNPLPVLILLDEAFFGPNNTRIPLKGALVLGKAYGEMNSQRALIQIIGISSVLPSGVTYENEQNLGYVTDAYGELGIHGQVVRNTGRQLALSFMSGFLSGGSQALAEQEVTSSRDSNNHLVKEVTGNSSKNAVFSGLAQSAGKVSEYYAKQSEDVVPAIHVQSGQGVYFIVQKGVTIHGLSRDVVALGHDVD